MRALWLGNGCVVPNSSVQSPKKSAREAVASTGAGWTSSSGTAALRLQPRAAWALMGRGVAEERKGEKAQAEADIAAAAAIAPKIATEAKQAGLAP